MTDPIIPAVLFALFVLALSIWFWRHVRSERARIRSFNEASRSRARRDMEEQQEWMKRVTAPSRTTPVVVKPVPSFDHARTGRTSSAHPNPSNVRPSTEQADRARAEERRRADEEADRRRRDDDSSPSSFWTPALDVGSSFDSSSSDASSSYDSGSSSSNDSTPDTSSSSDWSGGGGDFGGGGSSGEY